MKLKMELLYLQEAADHRDEDIAVTLQQIRTDRALFGPFLASDDWAWLESVAKKRADDTAIGKTGEETTHGD